MSICNLVSVFSVPIFFFFFISPCLRSKCNHFSVTMRTKLCPITRKQSQFIIRARNKNKNEWGHFYGCRIPKHETMIVYKRGISMWTIHLKVITVLSFLLYAFHNRKIESYTKYPSSTYTCGKSAAINEIRSQKLPTETMNHQIHFIFIAQRVFISVAYYFDFSQ